MEKLLQGLSKNMLLSRGSMSGISDTIPKQHLTTLVSLISISTSACTNQLFLPGIEVPVESNLRLVRIYFDTATFDDIERDEKIKMEAQLSLIGGTMGLFTGFSIISGVEIIFFLLRLVYNLGSCCKKQHIPENEY